MSLTFRRGTFSDVERFIEFLAEIRAGMSNQEWLYLDPPELVRERMADGTMGLWLAVDGDRLAAVFDILYPGLDSCNYGYDLNFSENELLRVVHMDTSAVHPDYRGQGLQSRMVHTVERELAGSGKRILLCTVHPENRFSLNNMLKQGFEIQKRVRKYGSERLMLRKNIF